MLVPPRATRALIHLENLKSNLAHLRDKAAGRMVCVAVKANAYGHGAVHVARAAEAMGISTFGVACASEAIELREAGIAGRIILYGIASPHEMEALASCSTEFFTCEKEHLAQLSATAQRLGVAVSVHLKIDTGMGRIGCQPEDAPDIAADIFGGTTFPGLRLAGVCTHLACADDPDPSSAAKQLSVFRAVVDKMRNAGDPGLVHASNSAGSIYFKQDDFTMVRPGISVYGYHPDRAKRDQIVLKPVMELRAPISFIKRVKAGTALSYGHRYTCQEDSWIATVAVGYADGLPRSASGKLKFLIGDLTYPQVGRICMDQCLVNLGSANKPCPAKTWDEVSIFGPDPRSNDADTIADASDTISYEITCGIAPRVPRVVVE